MFTDAGLRRARYSKGQHIIWDKLVPGLGLRIYPSGKKAFVLRYRLEKRRHIVVLAPLGVLSVEQARTRAREMLLAVLAGHDPRRVPQLRTLAAVAQEYVDAYARPHKRSWRKDVARLRLHILPTFGARELTDITTVELRDWHGQLSRRSPIEANRSLEVVSSLYSQAMVWGYCEKNPCHGIPRNREHARSRYVTKSELPRLWQAIEQDHDAAAFKLLLLTGMRKGELLNVRWEEVNFQDRVITLRNTKSGTPHVIPLSRAAMQVLLSLPKNRWVIAGRGGQKRWGLDSSWARICRKCGLVDVHIHDLRRTVATLLVGAGLTDRLIASLLNHKLPGVTSVYARVDLDALRDAVELLATTLSTLVRAQPDNTAVHAA